MRTNHWKCTSALVLLVLACLAMTACKKNKPAVTPTQEPTATAAPTQTSSPVPTNGPEETLPPEDTPVPTESAALDYQTVGTNSEGENYAFSAEVPKFELEEVDSYFEAKAARLYNGFLAELDENEGEGGSFELTYAVTYNQDGIISVVFQKYAYFGGAYPSLSYDCDTIDTTRNSRLLLSDVVNDPGFAKLQNLIEEYFPDRESVSTENLSRMIEESFSGEIFSLDGTVLHCYFPDYAFGYRGWTDVAVPYDALRAAGILADWVAA